MLIPGYDSIQQFAMLHNIAYMTVYNQMKRGYCPWPRRKISGVTNNSAYKCWENMVQRATNPKAQGAHNYIERGIEIDLIWKISFKEFIAHIGERPSSKHSIDRIDNNAGYFPGNIRWATHEEQVVNRRKLFGFVYKHKNKDR